MGNDTACVRENYDRIAAAYAQHYARELLHKPLDRELLCRFAAEVKGKRDVCDMGCAVRVERTPEHLGRRPAGISVEGKHTLIEQTILIWPAGPAAGWLPHGKMVQDVLLECRTGNDRRRDNGQCDPHPLTVKKEKQLVARDRPTHTASKMVHSCPRLVIPGRRIGEVIRRIKQRSIPQFIKIPVKLIGARLGDVVDLGRSIRSLIHG